MSQKNIFYVFYLKDWWKTKPYTQPNRTKFDISEADQAVCLFIKMLFII